MFFVLLPRPHPPGNTKGVANQGGYLRCSERFDHITDRRKETLLSFVTLQIDDGAGTPNQRMLTNPNAVHTRSTQKVECERRFWNGSFRELKEKINDVVHEQLMNTSYELSIIPINDSLAEDLIVSCCTEANNSVADECQMNPDVTKWAFVSEGSDNFAMLEQSIVTKKESQRDFTTGNQMHSFMSAVTMKYLIVILFIFCLSFIRSEVFIAALNFYMMMLIVSLIFHILYIPVCVRMLSAEAVLLNTFDVCDIFEKTMD